MSDATSPMGRGYTFAGVALIALGLLMPFIAMGAGVGNAKSASIGFTQAVGACALWGFVAWLVTRKSSASAKGKGVVTVGILVILTAVSGLAIHHREDEVGKKFLRDSLALEATQRKNVETLNQRFASVALSPYLTPEALTSKERVVAGQAALREYRALLQQRDELFLNYMKEAAALIAALPEGPMRASAESAAAVKLQSAQTHFKAVDGAQTAHTDAMEALFKWAEKNNRHMTLKDGKVLFQSQQLLTEFQGLAATLDTVAVRANMVREAAQAESAKAEASREENLKKVKALLE